MWTYIRNLFSKQSAVLVSQSCLNFGLLKRTVCTAIYDVFEIPYWRLAQVTISYLTQESKFIDCEL